MKTKILILIMLVSALICIHSQNSRTDFNEIYKYPFSAGFEYNSLTSMQDFGFDASITELTGIIRFPFPPKPQLLLLIQPGIIKFDSWDRIEPDKWDHTHYLASGGFGWSNRFSKNFEIIAELQAGASIAVFEHLDPAGKARSANYFTAGGGARLILNPSYNMSIDVHPSLRYLKYTGPVASFDLFDGLSFGFGVAANFRFGEDPDAPQAVIKSIRFSSAVLPPVFSAMQSYYVKSPITQIEIENTEKHSLYDVEVSFFQANFMDTPTKCLVISELKPGAKISVPLLASFNDNIFAKTGTTPLNGEITVSFTGRNKTLKQSSTVSYDLYDKNSLTWDDDRKVAAFITSSDSAIRNYTSTMRQYAKNDTAPNFSEPLQTAMQVFYGLKELGIMYQIDPTSPFDAAQDNPLIIDSISLPRDTLARKTGDCDDLTVLFCSLLETAGIETAFITVPGHIYAAFNTGVPAKDYRKININQNMTLSINNTLWVPVEITMIGTDSFLNAWKTGISQFSALDSKPELRGFFPARKSQEIFRPVGLKETDLGLQYGNKNIIVANFKRDLEKLIDEIIEDFEKEARKTNRKDKFNALGITAAQFGRTVKAEEAFNAAVSLDRNYVSAKINLGNLYYLQEEYQEALKTFIGIERILYGESRDTNPVYPKILLNISRAYFELENYDRSTDYYKRAANLDPALVQRFSYLAAKQDGSRAAQAETSRDILFIEGDY